MSKNERVLNHSKDTCVRVLNHSKDTLISTNGHVSLAELVTGATNKDIS